MPIYDYRCSACRRESEGFSSISERRNPPPCAKCGAESLKLVIKRATAMALKGSGWSDDGYSNNAIEQIHAAEIKAGLRNGRGETRDIVPINERPGQKKHYHS